MWRHLRQIGERLWRGNFWGRGEHETLFQFCSETKHENAKRNTISYEYYIVKINIKKCQQFFKIDFSRPLRQVGSSPRQGEYFVLAISQGACVLLESGCFSWMTTSCISLQGLLRYLESVKVKWKACGNTMYDYCLFWVVWFWKEPWN